MKLDGVIVRPVEPVHAPLRAQQAIARDISARLLEAKRRVTPVSQR
jgi:hypothetical protein